MENRKHVADEVSEADHRVADSDPAADIARGEARPETDGRDKAQYRGSIVREDIDPDEIDPGVAPRTPI